MVIKSGIIPREAFCIGNISIYWYAILICFGMLMGFFIAWRSDKKFGILFNDMLDLSLFMIPIGIISARAYYVLFNLEHYLGNPSEILNIRNGGLAIYGGLIGAIITVIVYCKIKKICLMDVLDFLAPIIPLAQAIGRWGNYINVEAYGKETNGPIQMEIIENGITKYVHPTFLYESVGNFILFIFLMIISRNRKYSGQIAAAYLLGYSVLRFFVEGLRTDSLMLGNFRVSQLLSLVIAICSAGYIFYKRYSRNKMSKSVEKQKFLE